jgi:hypothetical protein
LDFNEKITTNLFQSLLRESEIDSTRSQELWIGNVGCRHRSLPLVLNDLLLVICSLGSRGDKGNELGKLLAEAINIGVINPKEEEGFGFLGETGPVEKDQSEWNDSRTTWIYKISA